VYPGRSVHFYIPYFRIIYIYTFVSDDAGSERAVRIFERKCRRNVTDRSVPSALIYWTRWPGFFRPNSSSRKSFIDDTPLWYSVFVCLRRRFGITKNENQRNQRYIYIYIRRHVLLNIASRNENAFTKSRASTLPIYMYVKYATIKHVVYSLSALSRSVSLVARW